MTEWSAEKQAGLSYQMAVVYTIRRIEKEQPEPGFANTFMDVFRYYLRVLAANDNAQGYDTWPVLERMLGALLKAATAQDLADVLGGDGTAEST